MIDGSPDDPDHGSETEAVFDRIIEMVLGAPTYLTGAEAAAYAGLSGEQANPYWRAMGFPDAGSERVFTRSDAEALALVARWVRDGVLDESTSLEIVRALGLTISRLADWQADLAARILSELPHDVAPHDIESGMADILPGLEQLLIHSWRRHLAAVLGRGLGALGDSADAAGGFAASVGFADVAGFTRLTRVLGEHELSALVEGFETGAADLVALHGGRLVKTLGDEVMFVSQEADAAVAIAAELHEMFAGITSETRLRVGVATGPMILRMGDVYGATVNRASRLTALARPGASVIDSATEEALSDPRRWVLRAHRPRPLRGLGLVRAITVERRRE
jgi:adenylate cyclase